MPPKLLYRLVLAHVSALAIAASGTAHATEIIRVDTNAQGNGDGTSWVDAYAQLRPAIAAASQLPPGEVELWVARGSYTPAPAGGARTASFQLQSGMAIYGGFAGTESTRDERNPELHVTVLSGDLNGDDGPGFTNTQENSFHVVTAVRIGNGARLDGFTIVAGYADGEDGADRRGAGIYLLESGPQIEYCIVQGNYAVGDGGGAYADAGSNPTYKDCTFLDNVAGDDGGAVCNRDSHGSYVHCTFERNVATDSAGAMRNTGSGPTIDACSFTDNTAGNEGGAIQNSASNGTVQDCTFIHNSADRGGAVDLRDGALDIKTSTFVANTAGAGGAISNNGSSLTLSDCTLSENIARDEGGALLDSTGDSVCRNNTLTGNEARNGGAILLSRGSPSLIGCTFTRNYARENGGALSAESSDPMIRDCSFHDNAAEGHGGAVYGRESGSLMTRCTFTANIAGTDGGAVWQGLSTPTLANCLFAGNTADDDGGAVQVTDSQTNIGNCIFTGNTSLDNGGAIRAAGGNMVAGNCTFAGNRADAGGGVALADAELDLRNSILWGNLAENDDADTAQITGNTVTASHSCIQDWPNAGTDGNLNTPPMLVDLDGADDKLGTGDDNVRLGPGSACIDTGSDLVIVLDIADLDANGNNTEPVSIDADGQPRVSGQSVDMGAYEFICIDDHGCDDGRFCNGSEFCSTGACQTGPPPCEESLCDEDNDSCVECLESTDCDDGVFCNGPEYCTTGTCWDGSPPCPESLCDEVEAACADCLENGDCDDLDSCTTDRCRRGTCTHLPVHGCEDSDSDGVADAGDFCPNTTLESPVSISGCACEQLDEDGDGVDDCGDQCPATANGAEVGADGCECDGTDSDRDGVADCRDQCPDTQRDVDTDTFGCTLQADSETPTTPEGVNAEPNTTPDSDADQAVADDPAADPARPVSTHAGSAWCGALGVIPQLGMWFTLGTARLWRGSRRAKFRRT